MIVDDDLQAGGLLERVVRMNNHQAIVVNKSIHAMETAHSNEPDLFLLDLMMPDLNGYELCALLRADPKFSSTPIIVVSAMEDRESKTRAFTTGANEYITKPFDIVELGERIERLLVNGNS